MRSWYVRWFERSLEVYVKSKVSGREAISSNNILGRARRVLREGYLSKEDLLAVIDSMVRTRHLCQRSLGMLRKRLWRSSEKLL